MQQEVNNHLIYIKVLYLAYQRSMHSILKRDSIYSSLQLKAFYINFMHDNSFPLYLGNNT